MNSLRPWAVQVAEHDATYASTAMRIQDMSPTSGDLHPVLTSLHTRKPVLSPTNVIVSSIRACFLDAPSYMHLANRRGVPLVKRVITAP